MAAKLKKVKLEEKHRDLVKDFYCGSLPYETPMAEWIKKQAFWCQEKPGAKIKTWLYFTTDGAPLSPKNLVGYASLNTDNIPIEEPNGNPGVIKFLTLPMLAVQEDFKRQPENASNPEEKYSRQIVRDIQNEAMLRLRRSDAPPEPWLVLIVYPDAEPAQRLYLSCGFVRVPLFYYDEVRELYCPRMMYRLK
jgi:hypothetical protein